MPKKPMIDEELLKKIPAGTDKERFEWLLKKMLNHKPVPMPKKKKR